MARAGPDAPALRVTAAKCVRSLEIELWSFTNGSRLDPRNTRERQLALSGFSQSRAKGKLQERGDG